MGVQEAGEELGVSQAANPASSSSDPARARVLRTASASVPVTRPTVSLQGSNSQHESRAFIPADERMVFHNTARVVRSEFAVRRSCIVC